MLFLTSIKQVIITCDKNVHNRNKKFIKKSYFEKYLYNQYLSVVPDLENLTSRENKNIVLLRRWK